MFSTRRLILLSVFLLLGPVGCVPVAMNIAQKAWEDRSTADQIQDLKIHTNLIAEYVKIDNGLPVDVNTDVWEGRVLLTGVVDTDEKRTAVERIVRADKRVKVVYNEVIVASKDVVRRRRAATKAKTPPASEGDSVDVGRFASDLWIEAKIKVLLFAEKGVTSVNYSWQSVRNKVYIIGRAGSEIEKKVVVQIIRTTRGVLGMKEFIEVKPLGK